MNQNIHNTTLWKPKECHPPDGQQKQPFGTLWLGLLRVGEINFRGFENFGSETVEKIFLVLSEVGEKVKRLQIVSQRVRDKVLRSFE